MAIDLKALCCTLLILCALYEGADARKRRPGKGSDLLLASMQDSISLLIKLTTDQATKITSMTTKLDEAEAKIEQLKSELSDSQNNVAQLADAASSLKIESKAGMEKLKSELSTTLGKVVGLEAKQVELAEAASSFKNESKTGMEELKSELTTALGKVDSLEEKQVELAEAASSFKSFKNESTTEVEGLKRELSNLSSSQSSSQSKVSTLEEAQGELKATVAAVETNVASDIDDLTAKIEDISWPEGSYCILGSGSSCPAGFTRYSGSMRGISATSGVTSGAGISCHNCHYSTDYKASFYITKCCK